MSPVKVFGLAVLVIVVSSLCAVPAFAWLWPIMGFGNGYPASQGALPAIGNALGPVLPGTPEWGSGCICRAIPVIPGYAYGANARHGGLGVSPCVFPGLFGISGSFGR